MRVRIALTLGLTIGSLTLVAGCPTPVPPDGVIYNNTTDRTNNGASYVGSDACGACHPQVAEQHGLHGHAHILKRIEGAPPSYPPQAEVAGVPNPPAGLQYTDIAYVIGGFSRKANFVDQDGFLITNGFDGVDSQWNLAFPPSGAPAGFVPFEAGNPVRQPYDFSCFRCHTTGPAAQDPANPVFQDNRPGILGTWQEPGVQCESCHGPGSRHIPNPSARDLFVDNSAAFCGECHTRPGVSADVILATADGFIQNYQQYPELRASGGHSGFSCATCHNPHASASHDEAGLRNRCTDCHPTFTLGIHEGVIYANGDYVEPMSCESCHMPLASKSATAGLVGQANGRIADVRTHVFRISTEEADFRSVFTPDGSQVAKDSEGRAALTVDFVCLRCHNTERGFPFRLTVRSASEIAAGIHKFR